MKFTIQKQSLLRELGYIQNHVIDKKDIIPALSHVLIEASGKNVICLTGTDLDQTLSCETEGIVQKGGACALPARKLFEIVKNLPDAEIVIEVKSNQCTEIKCERSHFKLAGIKVKDMPELPKFKESVVQLPSAILRTMIEHTRFAITNDESRYTLSGAKFILRKKGVRMVATDGHRLSLIENKSITSKQEFDCLIPKKALAAVSNLSASHDGAIGISLDENHIYFETGARTLIARLLTGSFPSYEMILPKSSDYKVRFDSAELLQAVRRVAVMANKSRAVCLEFKAAKELRIHTREEGEGAAEETLGAKDYNGAAMIIGINSQFLIEYLSVIGAGTVSVEFNSPQQVVQISPLGEEGYNSLAVIMPMNLGVTQHAEQEGQTEETQTEHIEVEETEKSPREHSGVEQTQVGQTQENEEEPQALPKAA